MYVCIEHGDSSMYFNIWTDGQLLRSTSFARQFCGEMGCTMYYVVSYSVLYHVVNWPWFWLKSPIPEVSALNISALPSFNLFDIFAGETPVAYFITDLLCPRYSKKVCRTRWIRKIDDHVWVSEAQGSWLVNFDANQSWLSHTRDLRCHVSA
jgi:hypothetical protein